MNLVLFVGAVILLCTSVAIEAPKPPPPKRSPPKPPAITRQRNGIRLVGGSGPKGRLEVSSKDFWLTGGKGVAWRPLCDDSAFGDEGVQVMCELLGFKYGRKFFSPSVNYRDVKPNATRMEYPVGYMECYLDAEERRLLGSIDAPFVHGAGPEEDDELHRRGREGRGRALLAPLRGTVNIPAKAPYTCGFRLGDCDYNGPLVGIHCSNALLPPAPPPPPSPPSPPPAPPLRSTYIRLIGGMPNSAGHVEPNICASSASTECKYGRVELQVNAPGIGPVWAPLCAATSNSTLAGLAKLICYQITDYPEALPPSVTWFVHPDVPATPYTIPQGASNASEFDPSRYNAWVTVTGGDFNAARRVQDLQFQVSSSRCSSGRMFTVLCEVSVS